MFTLSALLVTSVLAAPEDTVLLEFSSPTCHYCRVMQTTVDRLQEKGYPVRVVNVEREQQLAQRFHARFLPTFILVHRGKEVARHEGATSFERLAGMFEKVPSDSRQADSRQSDLRQADLRQTPAINPPARSVRGQSPRSILPSLPLPKLGRRGDKPSPPSAEDRPHIIDRTDSDPYSNRSGHDPARDNPARDNPARDAPANSNSPTSNSNGARDGGDTSSDQSEQVAFQATVRLRVIDQGGDSFGTGTIVDEHAGYALIVTCGHLFREVGKNGKVEVDLFNGSGHPRTVPGRVITFDADERDIALVEIQPGVPVRPAPVASDIAMVRRGADVFSIGCSRGADPTLIRSRITGIDKYIGFPNIEVRGQPVVGRSGGGLFTAAGELIGICNAADPEDDEGIYAGLPMIHEELAAVGIQPGLKQPGLKQPGETQPEPRTHLADRDVDGRSSREGLDNAPAREFSPNEPRKPSEYGESDLRNNFANQALPMGVSQLICIVRTQENPQGELVVVDNPTPELLAELRRPGATKVADSGNSWTPVRKPLVDAID
jgi:thiol-disulfide isomerase/thioredoxin